MKSFDVKKMICVILSVMMTILIFASCGDGEKGDSSSSKTSAAEEDVTEVPTEATESLTVPTESPSVEQTDPATEPEPAAMEAKPEVHQETIECEYCGGDGMQECNVCGGKGYTNYGIGDVACSICGGSGKNQCVTCSGSGKRTAYYTSDGKEVDPTFLNAAWERYERFGGQTGLGVGFSDYYDDLWAQYYELNYSSILSGGQQIPVDEFFDSLDNGGTTPGGTTPVTPDLGEDTHQTTKCPKCGGEGTVKCTSCNGTGKIKRTGTVPSYGVGSGSGSYEYEERCRACNGTGKYMCTGCLGKGYIG